MRIFWQVTGEALDFALDTLGMDRVGLRERLMNLYLTLKVFPDVCDTLSRLKQAGMTTAILSNGSLANAESRGGWRPNQSFARRRALG
jgi:2-haloacid dehalogenase